MDNKPSEPHYTKEHEDAKKDLASGNNTNPTATRDLTQNVTKEDVKDPSVGEATPKQPEEVSDKDRVTSGAGNIQLPDGKSDVNEPAKESKSSKSK